jgi:MerR family transcriptional regulator/heat shock protein HspR
MYNSYDEPLYLISVVAKLMDIHPQTLRQYEREGLLKPSRTDGRMRLYSQRDIDKLKIILTLARDMGVNLAGIDIILQLKKEIEDLQYQVEQLKEAQGSIPKNKSVVVRKNDYQIVLISTED